MALNKDNNFLQSDIWRKFQEAVGHQTFRLESEPPSNPPLKRGEGLGFSASIIEHQLPVVGKYFYCPRGPIIGSSNDQIPISNQIPNPKSQINLLVNLAKKENAGWIRIDPKNKETLEIIKKDADYKISKAPHDMQPREILVMDITKAEEEILAGMKSKTRYNINLAQKKGVSINVIPAQAGIQETDFLDSGSGAGMTTRYINEFVRLVKLTEKRKSIKFHSANYYQKMLEVIPSNILKLYVAEYDGPASTHEDDRSSTRGGKIIAANLVIFFGDTATYLHGATDDEYRNVMAPYLLQWQAIKDAKKAGCLQYDFGGVKKISPLPPTPSPGGRGWLEKPGEVNSWSGITKFKLGFAPNTEPIIFPGSYDIIINKKRYYLYRIIQKMKYWIS